MMASRTLVARAAAVAVVVLVGCTHGAFAAKSTPVTDVRDSTHVKLYLRNNVGWFRSVTFVIYTPGSARGQVESKVLLPWQRTKFELPLGTKLFIASEEEVKLATAGGDLRQRAADLTVRPADEGEVYAIYKDGGGG